jgi:hypothetical protein
VLGSLSDRIQVALPCDTGFCCFLDRRVGSLSAVAIAPGSVFALAEIGNRRMEV